MKIYPTDYLYVFIHIAGIINQGPSNVTYIPGRSLLPIVLICNVTGFPSWEVNGTAHTPGDLLAGNEPGHNASGANIVINIPMNDTEYICLSNILGARAARSPPAFLYIAGKYDNLLMHCVATNVNIAYL